LQAASIARYLDPEGIGRILVVVNDIDEAECVRQVEALRPEYGPFASRVEVVRPDALFDARPASHAPRGLRQRFRLWFARRRWHYPFGVKSGWRGNRGWSVQQALKLAVARHGDSRFILILDAKNSFVRPVGSASFVSAQGRPLTYTEVPTDKFHGWIVGSFRLLGLTPPGREVPAPPTITPVCLTRSVLLGALDTLERRVGPAEAFFARARSQETEFMLVYAYVEGYCGGWDATFDPGLKPPASIFRADDSKVIDAVLTKVENGEADVFSIHSARVGGLTPEERRRISDIWRSRGLPADLVLPETV
jgi:hypothetical protein